MQNKWIQSLGRDDPLEEKMVTYSSILAGKIPQAEEPSRPQSMGSQRVGHDLVTKQQQQTWGLHLTSSSTNTLNFNLA